MCVLVRSNKAKSGESRGSSLKIEETVDIILQCEKTNRTCFGHASRQRKPR